MGQGNHNIPDNWTTKNIDNSTCLKAWPPRVLLTGAVTLTGVIPSLLMMLFRDWGSTSNSSSTNKIKSKNKYIEFLWSLMCYYIKCWFGCRDCFMKVFLLLNQSLNVRGLDTTNIKWALGRSLKVKNTIKISFFKILFQQF